jgi:hypothetical protein
MSVAFDLTSQLKLNGVELAALIWGIELAAWSW